MTYFIKDMNTLRQRAHSHIALLPVTDGDGTDMTLVALLNEAIAAELCGAVRYQHNHAMATSLQAHALARQYRAFANENLLNADRLAGRVVELGGIPDFSTRGLLTRILDPEQESIMEMVQRDSTAEDIVVDSLSTMVDSVGVGDIRTRQALTDVLDSEVGHAEELTILLGTMTPRTAPATTV